MYELNIQADNELKEFIVSVKGTDEQIRFNSSSRCN